MVDRSIALFGTTAPVPERRVLRAGPVSATFEAGSLRWIRIADREVVQAVAFLVRDTGWGTAIPEISNLSVAQEADTFKVTLDAHCKTRDGMIDWSATITGAADGTIAFEAVARPERDFKTNRTGFVVLHPLDGVVGAKVRVTYIDGREEDARFPELIDPYQPFVGVRALAHEVLPGLRAVCTMEGDAWETEDHRNWGDASYKTYVRPLSWGFPYELAGGEEVRQKVTVAFSGDRSALASAGEQQTPVALSLGAGGADGAGGGARMPDIGLGLPRTRLDEAAKAASLIGGDEGPGPRFLHCLMSPGEGDGAELIASYAAVASAVGAPLALEVILSSGADVRDMLQAVKSALTETGVEPIAISVVPGPPILQLNPIDTKDEAAIARIPELAREVLGRDVTRGGGVFGFFTELNRNRPPFAAIDFVTHMSSVIVHAADDEAVMENLASFAHIARSVSHISGNKPYWLGPANIAMDTNPYGALLDNPDQIRTTMVRMDPRQRGLFAAAWTVGLVAEAAKGGVAALVTAAPVGELGLVYARTGYAQPYFDDEAGAKVYPLTHVVRGAMHGAGARSLAVATSDASRVNAFGYARDGRRYVWLANVTAERQEVRLPRGLPPGAEICVLDAESFVKLTADPDYPENGARDVNGDTASLDAYAVARIVWEA